MTTTTEFQLVDINKLVPYANNARTHNKEQILKLRSSLREFGFVNPVIIDKEYNVLVSMQLTPTVFAIFKSFVLYSLISSLVTVAVSAATGGNCMT